MSALATREFEPVYLEASTARLTEYGKRWMHDRMTQVDLHWAGLREIAQLRAHEVDEGERIARELEASGCPTALTGMGQYLMAKLGDHSVAHASFTMPAAIGLALLTAAPTTASTGATVTQISYTTYAALTPTIGTWTTAATSATPSVVVNASTITFGGFTAGGATILGFGVFDSGTIATANMLSGATVTSTIISPTQTPPTIASGAMSLSLTGT